MIASKKVNFEDQRIMARMILKRRQWHKSHGLMGNGKIVQAEGQAVLPKGI